MRRHLPLLAICLGYFMVILDATIVNVALPSIGRDLGGGVGGLQWVVDAYTVVFAGLLLSAGSIGDLIGSRKVLDTGLGLFTAASAACALAPSVEVLVGARVAQGLGAALMVPSSLALLRAAYQDTAERARAVGAWGGVAGIAAASGPILGGVLVSIADWRAVFIVNLPVGLLAMWLSYRHLPKAGERSDAGLDPPGQVLGVLTLTLLTLGLIEGGSSGWGSPLALIGLLGFVPALLGFLAVERHARHPMLPLSLFRNRTFSGATFVGLAINLGFYGELFAISLYFQRLRGFSALETGLALVPEGVFVAVSSVLSGRLTGTYRTTRTDALRAAAGRRGLRRPGRRWAIDPVHGARPRPDRGRHRDGVHHARSDCGDDRVGARRPGGDRLRRAQRRAPGRGRDRRSAAGHAAGRQLVRVGAAPGNGGERRVVLDRRGGHRARRRPGGPPAARAACRAHRRS